VEQLAVQLQVVVAELALRAPALQERPEPVAVQALLPPQGQTLQLQGLVMATLPELNLADAEALLARLLANLLGVALRAWMALPHLPPAPPQELEQLQAVQQNLLEVGHQQVVVPAG